MVFVTGDLHGNFERFKPKYFPEQARMTKQDIMICAGDFGGVWFGDSRDDETLDWLERLPFTLAFVCGNHENYDALERYPVAEWHGGKVHRVRPHVLHLMRGQIFELEGSRFFTMGGAKSHDIEDGILEPDAPDFERRLMMLQRKPRARYRINHTMTCSKRTQSVKPTGRSGFRSFPQQRFSRIPANRTPSTVPHLIWCASWTALSISASRSR